MKRIAIIGGLAILLSGCSPLRSEIRDLGTQLGSLQEERAAREEYLRQLENSVDDLARDLGEVRANGDRDTAEILQRLIADRQQQTRDLRAAIEVARGEEAAISATVEEKEGELRQRKEDSLAALLDGAGSILTILLGGNILGTLVQGRRKRKGVEV